MVDAAAAAVVPYRKRIRKLEEQLAAALLRAEAAEAILRDLVDPGPCDHFDHDGQCQTHGWLEDGECVQARAQKLLAALPERTENA